MKTKNVVSAIALSACFGIAYNAQPVSAQPANNILSTGNASNEYVTLRFNVQPGSKYRMTQVAQVKEVVIAPPMRGRPAQKTEITSTSTNVLDYAVLYNNPDGTKQIRLTYGAIRNNTSVKVNSKTQAVPPSINVASRALVGQQIGLKISPEGQVSDVRGLDNIWKKAFSSVTAPGMTPKMRQQMQDSMKKMLGDNYMKSIMQQSGMMLPENPDKNWQFVDAAHRNRRTIAVRCQFATHVARPREWFAFNCRKRRFVDGRRAKNVVGWPNLNANGDYGNVFRHHDFG